jgi:hypothetical protein
MTTVDILAMHALADLGAREPEPAEIMRERAAMLPIRSFYVLAAMIGASPLDADGPAILQGSRMAAVAMRTYGGSRAARAALLAE